MSIPVDENLYNEAKKKVDGIYDKPSAYRSMAYSRFYLRAFREKYGEKKLAYKGKRPGELEKWRKEKWVDVRSFLDTPQDPKACGSIEYGKKEYPLCMPESKAKRYDKQELSALLFRKQELGKARLVKEPYLRDLYGKPITEVKVKDIMPLEAPKMIKEKKVKQIKPTKAKQIEVFRDEKKPEAAEEPRVARAVGRPRRQRTAEELTAIEQRKELAKSRKESVAARRVQAAERKAMPREKSRVPSTQQVRISQEPTVVSFD